MSWSLALQNGDLAFGSNGLSVTTGGAKLTQDLACAILEPMGNDSMHLAYGSLIDGGVDTDGNVYTGAIGMPNDQTTETFVRSEVQRICQNYQSQQISRNGSDVAIYGKSTLTADEALLAVNGLVIQQILDRLLVTATLQTGTNGLPFVATLGAS